MKKKKSSLHSLRKIKELNKDKKVERWLQNSASYFDVNPCKKPKIDDKAVYLKKQNGKTSAKTGKYSSMLKQTQKKKIAKPEVQPVSEIENEFLDSDSSGETQRKALQDSQSKLTKKPLLHRSESVPTKIKNDDFKKIKIKEEKTSLNTGFDDEDFVARNGHCKPPLVNKLSANRFENVNIKTEIKSPPKTAMRPASFVLKPTTTSCTQTDIDSGNLRDLLKCADELPDQLKSNAHYRFTINLGNDQFINKRDRMLVDGKSNNLEPWFGYLLDNYKSKHDYGGEEGCNCFITLDSRFKVMLSVNHSEMVASNVEVLIDGSNEDNWMRNIRDPIRIFNWIEKQVHAPTLENMELVNQIPEIIVTRLFPK